MITAAVLGLAAWSIWYTPARGPTQVDPRPNIILIILDDLDTGSMHAMPAVQRLVGDAGVSFSRHFVTTPLCCPARASIFTGLYAHNHGVWTNGPPDGGFPQYHQRGHETDNVALWLHTAGYRTMLVGKYLNAFPAGLADDYVPPGWDDWYAVLGDRRAGYNQYTMNEAGRITRPKVYQTDKLKAVVLELIRDTEKRDEQPFFAYVAPAAPHAPSRPAARHAALFEGARAPRGPSYNESDVRDKPRWLQGVEHLSRPTQRRLDRIYRRRLQTLAAADEMVAAIVKVLEENGELDRTYLFFTSDNGYLQGQHRFPSGKNAPYEEAIRVPLLVRGPGIIPGRTLDHLVGNIDYAPTFAELAGLRLPRAPDGRSLLPLLRSPPPEQAWRQDLLIEHHRSGDPFVIPEYAGLRTREHVYFEYGSGDVELYDLKEDPHQTRSRHLEANPALLRRLSGRLAVLRECRGAGCR